MKKLLLPLFAGMVLPFFSSAQVTLSGSLSGTYATLTAAFAAINTGGGVGAVTATITINHALTATASLNQTNYTVTVKPSGFRVLSGSLNSPLIQLNGADNVVIDGLNQLTITNSNTGATACAILLQTDASNNTIKNCTIEGATQATGYPFTNGVVKIRALSGSTGCDNNTITTNKIRDVSGLLPRHCIYAEGVSASVMNNNLVVSNNEISNFWNSAWASHGFYSYRYNQSVQITGNSFFQANVLTGSGGDSYSEPIFCEDGVSSTLSAGFVITNNFIGGSAAFATGAPYTVNNPGFGAFQGIAVNLGTSPVNSQMPLCSALLQGQVVISGQTLAPTP